MEIRGQATPLAKGFTGRPMEQFQQKRDKMRNRIGVERKFFRQSLRERMFAGAFRSLAEAEHCNVHW